MSNKEVSGARGLLWDMNGVLVDDEAIQDRTWDETLAAAGIELDVGWRQRFLGRQASAMLTELFPDDDAEAHEALLAEKHRRYVVACEIGLPVVPGALELIAAARGRGVSPGVVHSAWG